jgi:hypothetical protein
MGKIIKLTRKQLSEAAPAINRALITEEWSKFNSIAEITKRLSENPSVDDWFGLLNSDVVKSAKKHISEGCTIYDLTEKGISEKLIKSIKKVKKSIKRCSDEFVVSDVNDDVNDYHRRFVFTVFHAGKNGNGNSAITDTRQIYYMAQKVLGMGIDIRISDASFDIADDVSTWLVVFSFNFNDKPYKG